VYIRSKSYEIIMYFQSEQQDHLVKTIDNIGYRYCTWYKMFFNVMNLIHYKEKLLILAIKQCLFMSID